MATMNINCLDRVFENWVRVGNLLIDLYGLEMGLKEAERSWRDIWDYIEWRKTVLLGPPDSSCRIDTFM